MIPFTIKFILDDSTTLTFQSNEKPVKGDVYTIQSASGKAWDAKITEVSKVIAQDNKGGAILEYQCRLEKHEDAKVPIGFGKRS